MQNEARCPECRGEAFDDYFYIADDSDSPRTKNLGGILGRVVHLEPGETALLLGARGAGKSSLAFTAFAGISRPWVIATELEIAKALSYAKRLGASFGGVSKPRIVELPALDGKPPGFEWDLRMPAFGEWNSFVVDSLSGAGSPLELLDEIRALCRATGARAVLTSQVTVEGTARGGSTIEHDVDCVVRIERIDGTHRRIIVEKSRSDQEQTMLFRLMADGSIGLPDWGKRYYSVEGPGPDYNIVGYPSIKATPHAAILAATAKMKPDASDPPPALPHPPVAVAALDGGGLYGSRWQEPVDSEDRRAFALRHGLPYFDAATQKTHEPPPLKD